MRRTVRPVLRRAVGGGAALPGATLEYSVTVQNPGNVPAQYLLLRDDLDEVTPGYLAYVDQSRDALDPEQTVWEAISEGNDRILLGKREAGDQQLSVRDVYGMQLPKTELVTLSACNTGMSSTAVTPRSFS